MIPANGLIVGDFFHALSRRLIAKFACMDTVTCSVSGPEIRLCENAALLTAIGAILRTHRIAPDSWSVIERIHQGRIVGKAGQVVHAFVRRSWSFKNAYGVELTARIRSLLQF